MKTPKILSPKSISAYKAQIASYRVAQDTGSLMPPKNILNAPTKMMKDLGYSNGYIYDPETETGCSGQNCFPDNMKRVNLYQPVQDRNGKCKYSWIPGIQFQGKYR